MVVRMVRSRKKCLQWIVKILRKRRVPFYISAGFAAKLYGSPRPLKDIDIPDKYFQEVLNETRKYVTWGPKRWLCKPWDVHVFTLTHNGYKIDISSGDTMRFYDIKKEKWVPGHSNFSKATRKKVFDMIVPVIPKKDLLYYKRLLEQYSSKKHQKIDVDALCSKNI